MPSTFHHIERSEWERRFALHIQVETNLAGDTLASVVQAELQSWPADERDWLTEEPEDAAQSNLSYWGDDGEGE